MFSSGFNESTTINPETMSNSSTYEQDSNDEDGDESDECDEDDDSDLEGSDAYSSAEEEAEEVQFVTRSTAVSDKGDEPTSATIRSLGDVGEEEGAPSNELDKSDEEDVASGSRKVGHHERTSSHRYPTTTGHHREASQNDVDTGSVLQRRIGPGTTRKRAKPRRGLDGRPRFEVIVTDASYSTFRALVYYLYTDSVTFAPLASTYQALLEHAQHTSTPFPFASRKAYLQATFPLATTSVDKNGIRPCSSKAAYRLADKLGLAELKSRAFDFLIGSLTVQNVHPSVSVSSRAALMDADPLRGVWIVQSAFRGSEASRDCVPARQMGACSLLPLLQCLLVSVQNEVRASPSMRKVFNHSTSRFPTRSRSPPASQSASAASQASRTSGVESSRVSSIDRRNSSGRLSESSLSVVNPYRPLPPDPCPFTSAWSGRARSRSSESLLEPSSRGSHAVLSRGGT